MKYTIPMKASEAVSCFIMAVSPRFLKYVNLILNSKLVIFSIITSLPFLYKSRNVVYEVTDTQIYLPSDLESSSSVTDADSR